MRSTVTEEPKPRLEYLREDIAHYAERIRTLFRPEAGAVVTVIVRTAGISDGDVVVTAEREIEAALSAARRLFKAEEGV